MDPKDRNRRVGRSVGKLAPFAYTDGAARQTLYLAAWWLENYRTDQELAERLGKIVRDLIPSDQTHAAFLRSLMAPRQVARASPCLPTSRSGRPSGPRPKRS